MTTKLPKPGKALNTWLRARIKSDNVGRYSPPDRKFPALPQMFTIVETIDADGTVNVDYVGDTLSGYPAAEYVKAYCDMNNLKM